MMSQTLLVPVCQAFFLRQMSKYRPWTKDKRRAAKPKGARIPIPDVRGEVLFGIHPVTMALQVARRQMYMAFFKVGVDNARIDAIKAVCNSRHIDTLIVTGDVMDELAGNHPHQGVCMDVSPLEIPVISTDTDMDRSVLHNSSGPPAVWMLPYQLVDTMNMGAVLRSACFFGIQSVLLPSHYSSSLNPVVSKASAGGLEVMDLKTTKSSSHLRHCIHHWKAHGGQVVGSVCDPSDTRCTKVCDLVIDRPTMVVIGNEASGIPGPLQDMCDILVYIQGCQGNRNMTSLQPNSLNVSVATGILLHTIMTNREKG